MYSNSGLADCESEHYLVVAKFREKLAASKELARKIVGKKFNFNQLFKLEGSGTVSVFDFKQVCRFGELT